MNHETLDEIIDRVAGEWTAVAADLTLTARVRERMQLRRRPWLMPVLAAASMAGAIAVAVVLTGGEDTRPEVGDLSSRALAPVATFPVTVPQPDLSPTHFPAQRASAIVSMGEPPLAVPALIVAPLAMPEVAEIEPLHVAGLQIAEIDVDDPKEPR